MGGREGRPCDPGSPQTSPSSAGGSRNMVTMADKTSQWVGRGHRGVSLIAGSGVPILIAASQNHDMATPRPPSSSRLCCHVPKNCMWVPKILGLLRAHLLSPAPVGQGGLWVCHWEKCSCFPLPGVSVSHEQTGPLGEAWRRCTGAACSPAHLLLQGSPAGLHAALPRTVFANLAFYQPSSC